jgi:hypothetical protein
MSGADKQSFIRLLKLLTDGTQRAASE